MPTDTDSMKYDLTYHKYILDVAAFNTKTGIDFVAIEGSLTKAKDMMYRISRTVYNFIYAHTHYRNQMEYWLATQTDLRPIIQEALEEQARYQSDMSAEFLKYQSGINFQNGMQIPMDRIRGEVSISPDTVAILRDNKLLYTGQRFYVETHDYTTDGY
jgi:hypothetical protein